MKAKNARVVAAVVGIAGGLTLFQNCGKFGATIGAHDHSSHLHHSTPQIMRTSSTETINVDMDFTVHSESISGSALYAWSYKLNGAASGCVELTPRNTVSYSISCSTAGPLVVQAIVDDSGHQHQLNYSTNLSGASTGGEIQLTVNFEIPAGTNNSPWNTASTIVETFVGQTLRIRNQDSTNHRLHTSGRPCPHGNLIAPGATGDCVISQAYSKAANGAVYDHLDGTSAEFHLIAYDGRTLYQTHCASCHGALASSQHRNALVSQILSARTSVPAMANVAAIQNLTRRQIEAISYALGGR